MSYLAIPNLIAHEIQLAESTHLSDTSRSHIERLVMEAITKEHKVLISERNYWRNEHMKKSKVNNELAIYLKRHPEITSEQTIKLIDLLKQGKYIRDLSLTELN